MIKNLHIENFQSHKNTTLEFSPGVNVIIGGSDKGKTAILRALKWTIQNKPNGDFFRSWWGGDTKVQVDAITRLRTNSKNEYFIEGNPDPLASFKLEPPKEVLEYFNLDDINWQEQHDSAFLLSSSDGEVARMLNKTVDLSIIDSSQSNVNKALGVVNLDIKHHTLTINSLEESLEGFEDLEQMEKAVKRIKQKEGLFWNKQKNALQLSSCIDKIIEAKKASVKYNKISEFEIKLKSVEAKEKKFDKLLEESENLNRIIENLEDLHRKRKELKTFSTTPKDLNEIGDKLKALKEKQIYRNGLVISMDKLRQIRISKEGILNEIEELQAKMPKVCPTCGSSL